jgi:26S proteasome regulatory subunit T2
MEEEFVEHYQKKEPTKPEEDNEEFKKIEQLRGLPMNVGTLEEFIDEDHCIVSSTMGPEYYVPIMSFVDKDQL